ncbi:MAG: hypothetical protein IJE97_03845, partial [Thermoguttaceae bacterium]|nr:hypothetical protein [Thermoguttaceae bacterium]
MKGKEAPEQNGKLRRLSEKASRENRRGLRGLRKMTTMDEKKTDAAETSTGQNGENVENVGNSENGGNKGNDEVGETGKRRDLKRRGFWAAGVGAVALLAVVAFFVGDAAPEPPTEFAVLERAPTIYPD